MQPGITVDILTIQDVFDDVEFGLDRLRLGSSTVALQCCKDLASLVVFAFADQKARAIGQEGTQSPDAEGKEDLKRQRETPGDVAWGEREAKGEPLTSQQVVVLINGIRFSLGKLPVADAESRDTIRHLDDDKLAAALHLARFTLPDLCDTSLSVELSDTIGVRFTYARRCRVHSCADSSYNSAYHHLQMR